MDNYAQALTVAQRHFLDYAPEALAKRPGVQAAGPELVVPFLGGEARIHRQTGAVTCTLAGETWPAGYEEALAVYDWLCDAKPGAKASGEFCPVHSLPGVMVRGNGLLMTGGSLPERIDREPEAFCRACAVLGGERIPMGDLGFRLMVFPDLPVLLKFYFGDEDFSPALTPMWDKHTLDFVRYETVYYLASALFSRIKRQMGGSLPPQEAARPLQPNDKRR